jgi:formylglycine-generating enzyme required for sulfatase activity
MFFGLISSFEAKWSIETTGIIIFMKQNFGLHHLLIIGLTVILTACNGIGTAEIGDAALGTGGTSSSIVFAGISSIDQKTDSSLRINWTAHTDAVAYEIYNTTSGTIYVATISAPATSYTITGLIPGATYRFRVRAKDSEGTLDSNINNVSVAMSLAPNVPSALTLITPASSPGFSETPTIQVSGVKNGDTVKLFTDNTCATEVASGVAASSTINLTTSVLAPGSYTLYANAINSVPTASACSTASVAYQKLSCPTGYIPVISNAAVGTTSDFCVMKYEAKCVGSSCPTASPGATAVATSQSASAPWASITQTNAKIACTNLGTGYDLISNPEWMTVAYNIEATASNWDGGVVGTGALFRGHSDNSPASALAVSNTADPYDGTGNTAVQAMGSGREQKRTFTLSNGEVIWDLAGNVWEWTDWTLGGALASGPTTCTAAWTEFPSVSCGALAAADYMPGNPAGVVAANYNANYGLGLFYGGAGGAALRGGDWSNGTGAGAFTLSLFFAPSDAYTSVGFRCVYRP